MNTKYKNLFVVLIVMTLSVTVAAEENDTLKTAKPERSSFYDSNNYGIKFPIPPELDLYTREKPGPLASLFTAGQIIYLVNPEFKDENIGVKYSTNITESDLKDFKELLDSNPPHARLPGYRKISVSFIKIGKKADKEAVEHVYNMKGNVMGTLRQVLFIHNGKGFTFTCATSQERYGDTNRKIFDSIFSNMEFRK